MCRQASDCTNGLCQGGTCGCPGSDQTPCNGQCVDLTYDVDNCGACGNACGTGFTCDNGHCSCSGTVCGGGCYDLQSERSHCGSCTNACGSNFVCTAGTCTCPAYSPSSGDKMTTCGTRCTSLCYSSDCGTCGKTCSAGTWCHCNYNQPWFSSCY